MLKKGYKASAATPPKPENLNAGTRQRRKTQFRGTRKLHAINASDGAIAAHGHVQPAKPARGTVALFQGRAEYIEKYFETIEDLLERGFEVVTLDWRGQGGSARELAEQHKSHVDDFAQYQRDLAAFLARMKRLDCPKPWFALAHSTGGAILLENAHNGGGEFQRLVATAPIVDVYGLLFRAAPECSPIASTCWVLAECISPAASPLHACSSRAIC